MLRILVVERKISGKKQGNEKKVLEEAIKLHSGDLPASIKEMKGIET